MFKVGDSIKTAGRYAVIHDHKKEQIKVFGPETFHGIPISFPSCSRCGTGYPLYRLAAPFVKGPASPPRRTKLGYRIK
jgi:hypothetical protein